jgi:hypothetical protein
MHFTAVQARFQLGCPGKQGVLRIFTSLFTKYSCGNPERDMIGRMFLWHPCFLYLSFYCVRRIAGLSALPLASLFFGHCLSDNYPQSDKTTTTYPRPLQWGCTTGNAATEAHRTKTRTE